MSGTELDVTLTPELQSELDQTGVYMYEVDFDSASTAAVSGVVTLVNNGTIENNGSFAIPLTTAEDTTFSGGKVYFVVESLPAGDPSSLASEITEQSFINSTNAATDDFGYDSFEVTLTGGTSDAGNLTSVNGFALPMGASVAYDDNTSASVGYAVSGGAIASDISTISNGAGTATFAEGPLAGDFRMSTSPTEANAANPGTVSSTGAFPETAWLPYIQALENNAVASDIVITGQFNGAPDATGVWHNGGYYAYQLQWDATDQSFWLVPLASSQIQGDIQLSPDAIAENIYSQTGTVSVYANQSDAEPFTTTLVGANNQWGAVLAQFLTGFTGGFYGQEGTSPNSQITTPIDLNQNFNWDPDYAFGNDGTSTLGLPEGTQTSDPYSQIFYDDSNSYGSPYSDALMSQYTSGGPLLSMSQPDGTGDVSNIDLTIYADGETPAGYTQPSIANYVAPGGSDTYAVPTEQVGGNNIALNFFSAVANNQGISLNPGATITLSILTSDAGGTPVWSTITFDGSTTSGGLFQSWTITQSGGGYTATANGSTNSTGYMVISGLPTAASGVSWYQLTVEAADGSDAKAYNLYLTTGDNGQILNPAYTDQTGALAIDGLAEIATPATTDQYINTFTVDFPKGATVTYNPALVVENTGSISNFGASGFAATPTAPVVGIANNGTFTALSGQVNEDSNTITTTTEDELSFAWTGYNPNAGTVTVDNAGTTTITGYGWTGTAPVSGTIDQGGSITGWVNGFTNKTNPDDYAVVTIENSLGQSGTMSVQADADGDWSTGLVDLGNGTYTITMQDEAVISPGTMAPVTNVSDPLVLTVDVAGNANADNVIRVRCFHSGTRIATATGEALIEDLRCGDRIRTIDGQEEPILWIGQRTVDCTRHPRPEQVWPVRIAADAFGAGLPARDLFLSPDHAVFAEGVLVPVKHLINGVSIAQLPVDTVSYFHIELDRHAVLLAEALPAETYLDTGDRNAFGNGDGPTLLHPAWGGEARDVTLVMDALGYAPLHVEGPVVSRLRAQLAGSGGPSQRAA